MTKINTISPNSSELANFYIEQGYSIFPVGAEKKPHAYYKWKDHPISDSAVANLRWSSVNKNAAVGIITGKNSNLLVLDIDNKNGANGSASLERLEEEYCKLPETYVVKTPSGGYHYYFQYNDCGLRIDAGVMEGVDYRGEGGYVISAHSLIRDGEYTVEKNHPVAPLPLWLRDVLKRDHSNTSKKESPNSVGVGNRNNYLASIAGKQWNKGASYEELEAYLIDANESFPEPLPKNEVISVAKSISKYPRFDISVCTNEQDFSDNIVQEIQDEIIYVIALGFHSNVNDVWNADQGGLIMQQRVKALVTKACKQLEEIAAKMKKDDNKDTFLSLANKLKKLSFQKKCIEMLKSHPLILTKFDQLDTYPKLVGTQNGVFDLSTRQILTDASDKYVTKSLNVKYDIGAECPLFDSLMERLFPNTEEQAYILKVLAYALSGEADLHEFYIMVGSGANGKTTLMELISYIIGDYSVSLDPNSLIRKADNGISNDIAPLRGTRLCLTSETPNGAVLDVALIKRLVGGDMIKTRFLYKEYFEFVNKATIFMLTNFMPVFDGGDGGFKRRVRITPFNVVIPVNERDPKLLSKLKLEASGVFNRLLEAYDVFQVEGLKMPKSFKDVTEKFCEQSDLVKQFFEEHMERDESTKVSPSRAHRVYKEWSTDRLYKPMALNTFSNAMEAHTKIDRSRDNNSSTWRGLKIKYDPLTMLPS